MKTAYDLLLEIIKDKDITFVTNKLSLHIGTVKRWLELKKVPINYFNDLNALLNHKYPNIDTFRSNDQFFTSKETARYCFDKAMKIIKKLKVDVTNYIFIEPSAGCCNFYNLLPKNRRIGIDIEPKGDNASELIKQDYLTFKPKKAGKYIVIGNPPFGLRGNLALRFINHSYDFADFVAFILPPLFDSTGKGVPMKRVMKGYKLVHTEKLPLDSYIYPDGEKVNIATIFQVWSKFGDINLANKTIADVSKFIEIYSLSNGKTSGSKRNVDMIGHCDVYLPSTCFNGMRAYEKFNDLPNKRGYGIKILKNKDSIKSKIMKINWENKSFLSTNSAINLRKDIIIQTIIDAKILKGIKL